MKPILVLGAIAFVASFGEVFGDVRIGDAYVKEAAVELKCGSEVIKAKTDSTGSYRLSAKANGKCTISVTHDGQTPTVEVVVFEKPSRYRLVLEKKGDTWTLKRV
jgi:hypothetical protein